MGFIIFFKVLARATNEIKKKKKKKKKKKIKKKK